MEFSIRALVRFLRDEEGATAIEYAILASGIFLAIITAVQLLGVQVLDLYQQVVDGLSTVGPAPPPPSP